MEAKLAATGLQNVFRLSAATSDDAPDEYVAREWDSRLNAHYDLHSVPRKGLRFSDGERGCAMSHAMLWERVAAREDDKMPLLVLEDDVLLSAETATLADHAVAQLEQSYQPADRAILLYLGAHVAAWRNEQRIVTSTIELLGAEWLWQTHAYIIWPVAAKRLLQNLPIDMPVDNFLSRNVLERHVIAYVCRPELARQEAPYAKGDIVHSSLACKAAPPPAAPPAAISQRHRRRRSSASDRVGSGGTRSEPVVPPA